MACRVIPFNVLHLGEREPSFPKAAIQSTLPQRFLRSIKSSGRDEQGGQQGQRFENAVRRWSIRVRHAIELPLGAHGLPGPAPVQAQPQLIRTGLCVIEERVTYFRIDFQLRQAL